MQQLYRHSNALLGVDPDFTEKVLEDPAFLSDAWLLLQTEPVVQLLGMVNVNAITRELTALVVAPEHRRQGHGRRILSELRERNIPYHLSCLSTNAEALAFYRSVPWLKEGPSIDHVSRRQKIAFRLCYFTFLTQSAGEV